MNTTCRLAAILAADVVGKQSKLLWCMSPEVALNGPERAAFRGLLLEVERTWRASGPRFQFDPTRKWSVHRSTRFEHSICDAFVFRSLTNSIDSDLIGGQNAVRPPNRQRHMRLKQLGRREFI